MAVNAATVQAGSARAANTPAIRRTIDLAACGYGLAALTVISGWVLTRKYTLVDPELGIGYWLGITGASLMAILLLYPVRKRLPKLRLLGATRHWFRMHMVFGVAGPVLILYHCNFRFGSVNSNVALVCTLLVAGSGLVGRYLHARVYSGLDGHRKSLQQLIERARLSPEQKSRASAFAPHLIERMNRFDSAVLVPPQGFFSCLLLPAKLAVSTRIGCIRLVWHARWEIRRAARKAGVDRARRRKVQSAVTSLIGTHLRRVRRVAEFHSYERLFSLWHVFHLPFFYILVLTALIHVLAVHMY